MPPSCGEYLENVKRLLPNQSLRTVCVGGHDFVTGPIALLPLLFPTAATAPGQGVYPLLHSRMPDVNSREHHPSKEAR